MAELDHTQGRVLGPQPQGAHSQVKAAFGIKIGTSTCLRLVLWEFREESGT